MARFLECMLVSDENEAILTRWCIRYSRVLMKKREICTEICMTKLRQTKLQRTYNEDLGALLTHL